MAEPKAPKVAYRHNVADARHEIGVKIDGQFVPFAAVSDAQAAQLVENAQNRGGSGEAPDEEGGE